MRIKQFPSSFLSSSKPQWTEAQFWVDFSRPKCCRLWVPVGCGCSPRCPCCCCWVSRGPCWGLRFSQAQDPRDLRAGLWAQTERRERTLSSQGPLGRSVRMQTSFRSLCSSRVHLVALLGDRDRRREEGELWRETGEAGWGWAPGEKSPRPRVAAGQLTGALLFQPLRTGRLVSVPGPLRAPCSGAGGGGRGSAPPGPGLGLGVDGFPTLVGPGV